MLQTLRRARFKSKDGTKHEDIVLLQYDTESKKYVAAWVNWKKEVGAREAKETREEAAKLYELTLKNIKENGKFIDEDVFKKEHFEEVKMSKDTSTEIYTEKEIKLEPNMVDDAKYAAMTDEQKKEVYLVPEEHRVHIPQPEYYLNTGYLKDIGYIVKNNKNGLLIGDAGCGKNASIRHMAHILNQPLLEINLNGSTTVDEFVGKYHLIDGNTVWEDGVLTMAVRYGWWIHCAEVNACLPEIEFAMHGVLEKGRKLTLTQKGNEILIAKPQFRFFGSINPNYAGTHRLNEAFIDRFWAVPIDYPKPKEEVEILQKTTKITDKPLLTKMVEVANKAREEYKALKVSSPFSTRKLLDWAEAVHTYTPATAYLKAVISKVQTQDKNIFRDIAATIFSEPEFRNVLELKLGKSSY